jgi:hypothetical protein
VSDPNEPSRESTRLLELSGPEVSEPGCYLHLSSGLMVRVFPEDLESAFLRHPLVSAGRVVRLSDRPDTPVSMLRFIAATHQYPINF